MGRAVWQDGGEVSDRGAVEYAAHVGVKHVGAPSAGVVGAPRDVVGDCRGDVEGRRESGAGCRDGLQQTEVHVLRELVEEAAAGAQQDGHLVEDDLVDEPCFQLGLDPKAYPIRCQQHRAYSSTVLTTAAIR